MELVLCEFIFEKATPDNVLALVDGTSLLWRLELMGIDAGEKRWERVTESCAKLIGLEPWTSMVSRVLYARTISSLCMVPVLWENDTFIIPLGAFSLLLEIRC